MTTAKPSAKFLLEEIAASLSREKDYRKSGRHATEIYEEKDPEKIPFNILFSNTETLAPALYNATPRPVVRRRYKDADPMGAAACELGKRTLEFLIDSGDRNYETFDDGMKASVLASLVPGRGIMRLQFDADIEYSEEGEPVSSKNNTVCVKEWPWDKFSMGYALKWKDVPWISFEHSMTKADLEKNFGKDMADKIEVKNESDSDQDNKEALDCEDKLSSNESVTPVYEVWYKPTREVYWVAKDYSDQILKTMEDPYDLSGFYDCVEPLRLFKRIKGLIPRTLYRFYETQAKELNSLTLRISSIVKQIKVRGVYDTSMGEDLKKIFSEEQDGALVPVTNPALMQAQGGGDLGKYIWLVPLEKLVTTYVQLSQQRAAVKQVIYEITGISDILRGSSVASETATAQEIKNQWGTLRLKRQQKLVGVFARDNLRIMLELAMEKFDEATLKQMTGLPYPTIAEKQQAQQQLALVQQQMQMMQQPGMPPQPLPPEVQQLQATANQPAIGELQALLRNDKQRSYRIDIETNSTIDAEATEDKQDIAELLNAIAQFMSGVSPMIQEGVMPFEVAKEMLLTIVRRYNFGPTLEASIEKMQAPQQGKQDPEAQKQIEDAQKQLQQERQKLEQERQAFELEKQKAGLDIKAERQALQMEKSYALKEIEMAARFQEQKTQLNTQSAVMKASATIEKQLASAENQVGKMEEKAAAVTTAGEQQGQALQEVSKQFGELMQAMTTAMEQMATAASAPKRITDSKGRTLTVSPAVD